MEQMIWMKAKAFAAIKRIEDIADHLMIMNNLSYEVFEVTLNGLYTELDTELEWYRNYDPMVANFIRIALNEYFLGKDYYLAHYI